MATSPIAVRIEQVPRVTLTMDEAAAALGISRDFLDQHVVHELRTVRRGRKRLVSVDELQRWARVNSARWSD